MFSQFPQENSQEAYTRALMLSPKATEQEAVFEPPQELPQTHQLHTELQWTAAVLFLFRFLSRSGTSATTDSLTLVLG